MQCGDLFATTKFDEKLHLLLESLHFSPRTDHRVGAERFAVGIGVSRTDFMIEPASKLGELLEKIGASKKLGLIQVGSTNLARNSWRLPHSLWTAVDHI
ncbi:unnamed protein product, partial [Mesorhabditis spiculigera]